LSASCSLVFMLGVHWCNTTVIDDNAACQLGPKFKLVHVMQVSQTHIGNPRIIMTARVLRHVSEHAAVQKLPSEALAVLQQNLGEVVEVSLLASLVSFSVCIANYFIVTSYCMLIPFHKAF
jgi:Asp-tRNA(Asn)/Glu-tRNA(Gln) amidotransferase A subunit family amidase